MKHEIKRISTQDHYQWSAGVRVFMNCALISSFMCGTLSGRWLPTPSQPTTSMSHEDIVVRTTYAKVSYAIQLGVIHAFLDRFAPEARRAITRAQLDKQIAQESVVFEIRGLQSGNIKDIAEEKYSTLVSKPSGEKVLAIVPVQFTYNENGRKVLEMDARAFWKQGQNLQGEDWNVTLGQALAMMPDRYDRYARFTLAVRFGGESRNAKAIFLFGTGRDGTEKIMTVDTLTGIYGGAVQSFTTLSPYPSTLLETKLRDYSGIAEWLRLGQLSRTGCLPGKRQVCCDLRKLSCGVEAGDLKTALAAPLSH